MRDGRDRAAGEAPEPGTGAERPGVPLVVPAKVRVPATDALPRERLEARLGDAFGRRLTLVVAPAGSGKTTLVARFAATCGVPVAWYRAETWDADEPPSSAISRRRCRSPSRTSPGGLDDHRRRCPQPRGEARDPSRPCSSSTTSTPSRTPPAEAAFGRLVDWSPGWLALVVASRVAPGLNLSRLRVSGDLLEFGTDDLRFRAWEVEQLFRDVYHDPVPPADLAVLARRTEGWAAGLQLFHLATRGRSAEERRRVLGGPGSSGRLLREYLAQNVMVGLPPELRRFLHGHVRPRPPVGPAVRPAPGHCRAAARCSTTWRGAACSRCPRRMAATPTATTRCCASTSTGCSWRRSAKRGARERHAVAGRLLEADGRSPRRSGPTAARRTGTRSGGCSAAQGERLAASDAGGWIEALPPAIERHDPWVALAAARRARNDGRWTAALAAYARAEAEFGPARAADAPRRERLTLAAWMDPSAIPPADASGASCVPGSSAIRRTVARDSGA